MTPPDPDARRRRLLYRATHRGLRENDILIGGYVAACIGTFGPGELDELEKLLEWPDTDLNDWITGRRPIPSERNLAILREIRLKAAKR